MFEAVIITLIQICLFAAVIFLILWVVQSVLGIPLPTKVLQILWVVFGLLVLLWIVRLMAPAMSGKGGLFGLLAYPMLA